MKKYEEFMNEAFFRGAMDVPKDQRRDYLKALMKQDLKNQKATKETKSTDKDVSALLSLLKSPIDWNYEYSDDHKVWKDNNQRIQRILSIYKLLSDEHKAKVSSAMNKAGFNVK